MTVVGVQVALVYGKQHDDALLTRDPVSPFVRQAIAQRVDARSDKFFQPCFFWIVPLLFVVIVVPGILVIVEMGLLEDLRHQSIVDGGRAKHISLLHETICRLLDGEQSLGNDGCIAFECIGDLAAIDGRVHREDLLSGSHEVAIGMAHPKLPHVPGIVSKRAHDVCLSLLGLAIDRVDVVYEEDDLHPAAALSGSGKARPLGSPVWRMVRCQLNRSFPARQFSILVCVAGDDAKAQDVLKPANGLFEVAHTQLNPACFTHCLLLSNRNTLWHSVRSIL